jgi:ligand-binding sensor domain-containing protein
MNGARRAFSEWRPNGALLWKGDFVGFRPHGTWTRFDTAGAVLQTINYDHGAIVKSASDSSGRASEGSAAYSVEPVTGLGAVKALCADAGCVWVGAKSGAFHFTEKAVVDKHYTTANGLPGNSVSALAIDGSGGTWFGVEQSAIDEVPSGGACCITVMGTPLAKLSSENGEISGGQALGRTYDTRYAVAAFVNNKWRYYDSVGDASYVPPVNRIVCVKGETWFGSLNGMRRTGNTPNATVAARLSNCTGPIAESPDGTVWGAAFDTLYKIAGDSLTAYGLGASRRDITALATDPHGQLFALSSTAIRSFDSGAFKDVCGLGEYAVLPNSSLIVEPEGSFVFASDKGLVRCGSKERTVIVPGSKLDKQTISCFARGANEYWIGTPSGLYRASSNTVAPCATPVGPPARYASLCCAGPGKLVHAYFNGIGMYRWNGVAWKLFDSTAFGEVNSMVALRDSTVFVGADAGLFLLKGNSTLNLGLHNTLASGKVTVTSLDGAGGLFYVLDKFRVVHAGSNAFAVVHEQTPVIDGEITALFSDATSRLWIADRNGISVFVRDSLIRSYSASSGLPLFPITQVFQSGDGTMYARSIESVFRLEGDRWNSIGTQDNINGAVISKIAEDRRGNLWVGTKDGLCLFEKGRQGFRQIRNGLLDKEVNDLAVAGDGSLWVATDKGLSRVTER